MIYGLDYLGGARYPDVIRRYHPKGRAAGGFARAFGDFFLVAKDLSDRSAAPVIRMQLVWDGSHVYGDDCLRQAIREAKRYDKLSGYARIQLSPFCEHNHKNPDRFLDAVHEAAPSCEIINTPWKGAWSKRYKNETHSLAKSSAAHNFSWDGADCLIGGYVAPPSEILFLWTPACNGKRDASDTTPIAQRKAWPTRETINRLRRLER